MAAHLQWQYDERLTLQQKNFLAALKQSLCIVSAALELMHEYETEVNREARTSKNAHYDWMRNEVYAMYYNDIKSDVKDFGESQLHKLMIGVPINRKIKRLDKESNTIEIIEETSDPIPDKTAVIFFNKTQNKDRGYIERQELTTPEGIKINGMAPIILNVNPDTSNESDKSE